MAIIRACGHCGVNLDTTLHRPDCDRPREKLWDPRIPASDIPESTHLCPRCGRRYMSQGGCGVCGTRLEEFPTRITRETMFLEICETIRNRSTCKRGKVGCVIVKDSRIVSMGYNGAPPGAPHCFELGCEVEENNHEAGCQRSIHAEANAIAFAARAGVSTEGGEIYCTHAPCLKCAQLIVSAGVKGVHYRTEYRRPEGVSLLRELGLGVHHIIGPYEF